LKIDVALSATLETAEVTAPATLPIVDLRTGFAVVFELADFAAAEAVRAALGDVPRLPNPAFFFGAASTSLLRLAIAALAAAFDLDFGVAFFAIGFSLKKSGNYTKRGGLDFRSERTLCSRAAAVGSADYLENRLGRPRQNPLR